MFWWLKVVSAADVDDVLDGAAKHFTERGRSVGLQLIMTHVEVTTKYMCPSTCHNHKRAAKPVQRLRLSPLVLRESKVGLVHAVDDYAQH